MQTMILIAVLAILVGILAAGVDVRPARPFAAPKSQTRAGTLTIDLECDASNALDNLHKVVAGLERIQELQAATGVKGRVGIREPKRTAPGKALLKAKRR